MDNDKWLSGALSYIGGLVSAGALLAIYRVFAGYHIVNLSIDLKPSRTPRNDTSQHDLVVVVGLVKGKSATLAIRDLRVIADYGDRQLHTVKVDTDLNDLGRPLNLAPGEKTQFACHFIVPPTAICRIEVRIRAETLRPSILGQRIGYAIASGWRASAISVPQTPQGLARSTVVKSSRIHENREGY